MLQPKVVEVVRSGNEALTWLRGGWGGVSWNFIDSLGLREGLIGLSMKMGLILQVGLS